MYYFSEGPQKYKNTVVVYGWHPPETRFGIRDMTRTVRLLHHVMSIQTHTCRIKRHIKMRAAPLFSAIEKTKTAATYRDSLMTSGFRFLPLSMDVDAFRVSASSSACE